MLYGGEPTLRVPLIIELMDRFPKVRFMLQTNGLLVNQIPEDYVKRFHSILVSVDGTEETTDGYRSKGVYQKVIKNVRWLKEIGYEGDTVARMAVSDGWRNHTIQASQGWSRIGFPGSRKEE
jgi:MoaA/NifB/PqqE/SkfB family radical SAM enzyme